MDVPWRNRRTATNSSSRKASTRSSSPTSGRCARPCNTSRLFPAGRFERRGEVLGRAGVRGWRLRFSEGLGEPCRREEHAVRCQESVRWSPAQLDRADPFPAQGRRERDRVPERDEEEGKTQLLPRARRCGRYVVMPDRRGEEHRAAGCHPGLAERHRCDGTRNMPGHLGAERAREPGHGQGAPTSHVRARQAPQRADEAGQLLGNRRPIDERRGSPGDRPTRFHMIGPSQPTRSRWGPHSGPNSDHCSHLFGASQGRELPLLVYGLCGKSIHWQGPRPATEVPLSPPVRGESEIARRRAVCT